MNYPITGILTIADAYEAARINVLQPLDIAMKGTR